MHDVGFSVDINVDVGFSVDINVNVDVVVDVVDIFLSKFALTTRSFN